MPQLMIDDSVREQLRAALPDARRLLDAPQPAGDPATATYGADGSTIRSLRGLSPALDGERQIDVYRAWARREMPETAERNGFRSRPEFEAWYEARLQGLDQAFRNLLEAHQRHKLADLYVKWSARLTEVKAPTRRGFVAYGHCPLDSKSLEKLGSLAPGTVLNPSPSMNAVTSERAYIYAQGIVREACAHIPCTPLEFDVIAWDRPHERPGRD